MNHSFIFSLVHWPVKKSIIINIELEQHSPIGKHLFIVKKSYYKIRICRLYTLLTETGHSHASSEKSAAYMQVYKLPATNGATVSGSHFKYFGA